MDNMQFGKTKKGNVSHLGILKNMGALLSLGKTDFANIKLYRKDKIFKESPRGLGDRQLYLNFS
jgi:hypothetical protein